MRLPAFSSASTPARKPASTRARHRRTTAPSAVTLGLVGVAAVAAIANPAVGALSSAAAEGSSPTTTRGTSIATSEALLERATTTGTSRSSARAGAITVAAASPFAASGLTAINVDQGTAVPAALLTVTANDSAATKAARAGLAAAVTGYDQTRAAYLAARGVEAQRQQDVRRQLATGQTTGATPTLADNQLAAARERTVEAATAHRAAIYAVNNAKQTIAPLVAKDTAAAAVRAQAARAQALKDGSLIALPGGRTAPSIAPGTPVPGGRGYVVTPEVSRWIGQALTTLYQNGYPVQPGDAANLAIIIFNESGGDPTVQNNYDSNAAKGIPSFGLMQTIGPTFDAFALPSAKDRSNPVHQIMAGARYGAQTYGSLAKVPGVASANSGGGYQPY